MVCRKERNANDLVSSLEKMTEGHEIKRSVNCFVRSLLEISHLL